MLIDYVASDLAILALVSEHISRVHVLDQTLATVENLSERECKKQGIRALRKSMNFAENDNAMLELAALSTVCDLAPMAEGNRTLVRKGLRAIATTERPGLRALMKVARVDPAKS